MAVALRVLVQRQPGCRLGARRQLRLAWPELGWVQQVELMAPVMVTRPAMPAQPREMSMQLANSLA